MERKTHKFAFPVRLFVVMSAFLFMANATVSLAASNKKKTPAAPITAVQQAESRIKQLNASLKITEKQQSLWSNVTRVMRENAREMDALSKERAEKTNTMNAVEHIKFHSRITEAQLDQQRKFLPPFESLYANLSDDQKSTIDDIFRTGKHGKQTIK